jgi:hypothetical protein
MHKQKKAYFVKTIVAPEQVLTFSQGRFKSVENASIKNGQPRIRSE